MANRQKIWTADEVRALGVRLDGVTACEIVYGVGRTTAYDLLRRGEVDFPVIRRSRKWMVPTSAVLALLGVDDQVSDAA
ncbi:MAG: helix-turn-helix domain-containing protein [Micromonosporaceae bacterium]|nr:helix-turn-helix domain-containing protein [Micromonosporaceae bacterium]